jgi:hypothetical protein
MARSTAHGSNESDRIASAQALSRTDAMRVDGDQKSIN